MERKQAILMMIDDYHNIHTIRRPQDQNTTTQVDHLCTIIVKIVKKAPASPFTSLHSIHNPSGTDVNLLVTNLRSNQFFLVK